MKNLLTYLTALLVVFALNADAGDIHEAAKAGNLDQLKQLLDENPELLNEKNERGSAPLMEAVTGNQTEVVDFLLDRGADIKTTNNRGSTPLHLAAYFGYESLVKYFLEKGLDVNARSNSGFTPLMFATYMGHFGTVRILYEAGTDMAINDNDYGGTAFHWACSKGPVAMAELVLSLDGDLNGRSTTDSSTPIFWSTYARNLETTQFLIDKGADINAKMPDGWTALHNSARNGHVEGAQLLIKSGADLEARSENGWTPLFAACEGGSLDMVKLLLENGAEANITDSSGFTPLHFAVFGENIELVDLLLSEGIDVNVQNENGSTLLHAAVRRGETEMAKNFILHGADVNAINNNGETPLAIAVVQGYDEIIDMLLKNGANPEQVDSQYNRTPLHWAAIKGNTAAANYLLESGAEVNAEDNKEKTPIYYAARLGYDDLFEYLKKSGAEFSGSDIDYDNSPAIEKQLNIGEAYLWYLGHCGWAFKTKNHLLIFDYLDRGKDPARPLLANGHINPAEIAGQNVTMFVTHEHPDHFDTCIFALNNTVENIDYIFGFRPEELRQFQDSGYPGPDYTYIGHRENKTIDDMEIHTIEANDAGVGFMVTVDGVTIYHAGDHAGWREGEKDGFTREIDYLADLNKSVDFALLNVTGCHIQDTIALAESVGYALEKLKPALWIPTHGLDSEYKYRAFADKIAAEGFKNRALCAEYRGDRLYYQKAGI